MLSLGAEQEVFAVTTEGRGYQIRDNAFDWPTFVPAHAILLQIPRALTQSLILSCFNLITLANCSILALLSYLDSVTKKRRIRLRSKSVFSI